MKDVHIDVPTYLCNLIQKIHHQLFSIKYQVKKYHLTPKALNNLFRELRIFGQLNTNGFFIFLFENFTQHMPKPQGVALRPNNFQNFSFSG